MPLIMPVDIVLLWCIYSYSSKQSNDHNPFAEHSSWDSFWGRLGSVVPGQMLAYMDCKSSLGPHFTFFPHLSLIPPLFELLYMVHMYKLITHHLFVAITNAIILCQVLLTSTSQHVSGNIFTYDC